MKAGLRQGFTTGSAATAAAMAALSRLLFDETPSSCDIPLPPGGRLRVPVERVSGPCGDGAVEASVIKDAGDDPDVTHGARISCRAWFGPAGPTGPAGPGGTEDTENQDARDRPRTVVIEGGRGVGRVTLPGLPIPPGQAAINPGPRRQIRAAILEVLDRAMRENVPVPSGAVHALIEVERGEELAQKTMNPRLGIVGGVSILGESGIVVPYSLASWEASICEAMDVAGAMGISELVLTTGRRSERFHQALTPGAPPQAFVQIADFFAFSLAQAAKRGFARLTLACFFGKLVKMAHAMEYTHAKSGEIDFTRLADWARRADVAGEAVRAVETANTARHVLEIVRDDPSRERFLEMTARQALKAARRFAGPGPRLEVALYDFEGDPLLFCAEGG